MINKQHISKFTYLLNIFIQSIKFTEKEKINCFQKKTNDFWNTIIDDFINNYNPITQQNEWIWETYKSQSAIDGNDLSVNKQKQQINFDKIFETIIQIIKNNEIYCSRNIQQSNKIIQGYKLLSFYSQNQGNNIQIQIKDQQKIPKKVNNPFYLFNHPTVQSKQKQQNLRLAKLSNQTILINQKDQIDKSHFYSDYYEQQIKKSLVLINPSIQYLVNLLNKRQIIKEQYLYKLITQTPDLIIITNNDFSTILSLISYQIIFNEVEEKQYDNSNNYKKMKILTTHSIYQKYLQVFAFLSKFSQKLYKLQNQSKNYHENIQQEINFFKEQIKRITSNQQSRLKELFKYNFFIVSPNIPFQYLTLSFYLRSKNLYIYESYDLEIQFSSSNSSIEKEHIKCLIQGPSLSNIKQIYYGHKNNKLSEKEYIQIIKRIQYKFEQDKKQQNYKIAQLRTKNSKVYQHNYCTLVTFEQNTYVQIDYLKDYKANLSKTIKITQQFNIAGGKQNKQNNILYRNPYEIPLKKKQLFYPELRNNQFFQLLTNQQILFILNNGILVEYINSQTVYNSNIKLEDVYIILRGKVQIKNSKEQENQIKILKRNGLFGWRYFLTEFYSDQIMLYPQKKVTPQISYFENLSNISMKSYDYQEQNQIIPSEKSFNMKVISAKAIILKISFNFLDFQLFYKRLILLKNFYSKIK